MKKAILFLMLCVGFTLSAQNFGSITGFGTVADTLVASATKTYTFNYVGSVASKCEIVLFTDAISGTPAYSAVLSKQIGGYGYLPMDTITHSGGGDKLALFDVFDLTANNYKITIVATSGTQKSRLYVKGVYRQ